MGYRYFDRANKEVLFPFGHGLSYTDFKISEFKIESPSFDFEVHDSYKLSFLVKNIGFREGKEVVQLYLHRKNLQGYGVKKKLLGFKKVLLHPGEEKEITMSLNKENFLEYDEVKKRNILVEEQYELLLGTSSQKLPLKQDMFLVGEKKSKRNLSPFYDTLIGYPTREDFITLLGRPMKKSLKKNKYTIDSTLSDMIKESQMKPILNILKKVLKSSTGTDKSGEEGFQTVYVMLMETPIKRLSLVSPEQMPKNLGNALVHVGNKQYGKAVKEMIFKRKTK